MKHLRKQAFLILTILWICVIFSFSLQSGDESALASTFVLDFLAFVLPFLKDPQHIKNAVLILRKTAHFTEYFILGCLSYKTAQENKQNKILFLGYVIPVIDESLQLFSPGRSASPIDMGIDMLGYTVGWIIMRSITRFFRSNNKKNENK